MENLLKYLTEAFLSQTENYLLALFTLFIFSFILFYISRRYILKGLKYITKNTSTFWGRVLFAPNLLSQLSLMAPMILFHLGLGFVSGIPLQIGSILERMSLVALVLVSIKSLSILMWQFNEVYSQLDRSRNRPIKGIVQVLIILLYIAGAIVTISIIVNRSPLIFLSGLGAMTAVLLLVFRDTLLSLVAGVQLTTNNLVRVGDWIEMPQFSADGDVIDIALHSVKVQNWDRTITSIPTHKFLEHAFKNWRGMSDSGGRRIKRSLLIDISSIKFLNEEEIEKFKKFVSLKPYIEQKEAELKEYNAQFDPSLKVNARRLTNIGTFRAYINCYLKQHPQVHQDMIFMVRQLAPTDHGVPLEIYLFIKDIRWVHYEAAQSDIFDHLFAIISEFDLRIHQSPTGFDMRALADNQGFKK